MQRLTEEIVRYDPTSPSGLRWATNIYSGMYKNILMVSEGDAAGSYNGSKQGGNYYKFQFDSVKYLCHKVIWEMTNGEVPKGYVVDHKDRNTRNNQLDNLRMITYEENCKNRKMLPNNTSGVTGVYLKEQNGYTSWVAVWTEGAFKLKTKAFSTNKFGYDGAFLLACELRDDKVSDPAFQYSHNHGKG
jgi:hypothetical protein